MKNKLPYVVKVIIAALLAFAVLSLLSLFYYNVPNRTINTGETTDYKWEPDSIYSKLTEGLVLFNKVNNEGFHNVNDYDNDRQIDVLIMGSSHTEAFNVKDDETFSEVLKGISGLNTYNIGISDHSIEHCVQNLDKALSKYNPSYVVIETMNVSIYPETIEKTINNQITKASSFDDEILKTLQNIKYLRLVYRQFENVNKQNNVVDVTKSVNTEESMDKLMSHIKTICDKHNTNCIIVYHPTLSVDNDMNISVNTNREDLGIIETACLNNGIKFINMEEDFINYYKENNILPHGFNNTIPGQGHLNKYGHMLIAEKLNKEIERN